MSARTTLVVSLGTALICIGGIAHAASTDATLSALSLEDKNGATVSFSPDFDPANGSYTLDAHAALDRITVKGTANDGNASVAYLDAVDQPLIDADTEADDLQVDLDVGTNTIKVKVTAEDTVTSGTYTIVVTRAAPTASADALLSNLDESNAVSAVVGKSNEEPNAKYAQAVQFRTGSNELGYNLTTVRAVLANATDSDGVRVRIFNSRTNGSPFEIVYTLSNPTLSDGVNTFSLPASATLEKETWYFVVFDSTASGTGNDYQVRATASDSLNSMASGWSLNAERHSNNNGSFYWYTHAEVPLIEINGTEVTESNDANLSALTVADGNDRFVTLLSPKFNSSVAAYTSHAASLVDRITVEATPNNADATVAYLDESDQELSDADTGTEGFQVDLAIGETTFKFQVTAADAVTTRTYTLVVTRDEILASPDAFLSNLDEPITGGVYVGTYGGYMHAMGFQTGDSEAGYILESVKLIFYYVDKSAGVRIRIFDSTPEGLPNQPVHTLINPPKKIGVLEFQAPANARLEKDTRYFVLMDSKNAHRGKYYKVRRTTSHVINTVAPGWEMDTVQYDGAPNEEWGTLDTVFVFELNGHAYVPSADASLAGLDLTWDDDGVETVIALDPVFDAATTAYAASVASGVGRITIAGTKNDDGAEVVYLDGAESVRTDADADANGFQVDLDVGTNTIKARVTAEDGDTIQTYTVAVTRRADVTAPAGAGCNGRWSCAGHRLRRGARSRFRPLEQRVRSREDAKWRFGDGCRARRLALDQRRDRDIDAGDCRIGFGLGRKGELHEADHRYGQQARRRERQRGGGLRRPGGDQRNGRGSPGCTVGAIAVGGNHMAGGVVDGADRQRRGCHGLRCAIPFDERELA